MLELLVAMLLIALMAAEPLSTVEAPMAARAAMLAVRLLELLGTRFLVASVDAEALSA